MATNPDSTKQERIAALAELSPKMLASMLVEASEYVATLEQGEANLLRSNAARLREINALTQQEEILTRRIQRLEVTIDDVHAKRGALLREAQNRSCEIAALKQELHARTAEFEEKYYGLQNENRALQKRLREAEAALGVPCSDEWDVYSDAGMRGSCEIKKPTPEETQRWAMDAALNDFLQTKTLD